MQRPDNFLWDGATDGDDTAAAISVCITASPAAFALVSGVLADYVLRFPNRELQDETDRALIGIDQAQRDAIIHIMLEMNRQIECGEDEVFMFQLRQNPFDSCQIEQSTDGGMTWTLAYDFGLCPPRDSTAVTVNNFYTTQLTTVQQFYDYYTENYTSSITDIYVNLGYGAGEDEDEWIDLALCYTARALVDILCAAALEFYAQLDTILNAVKLAAALAAGIAALIGLAGSGGAASPALAGLASGATYAAAGIALGAVVGEVLYQITIDFAKETFEDLDARAEVACAIYVMLRGVDITQTAFADSLTGVSFSGNAIGIAVWVQTMMQEQATYATFTGKMDENWRSARAGLLPPCACEEGGEDFEEFIDFTGGSMPAGWSIIATAGTHSPGVGVLAGSASGQPILLLYTPSFAFTATEVIIHTTGTQAGDFYQTAVPSDFTGFVDNFNILPGNVPDYSVPGLPATFSGEIRIGLANNQGSQTLTGITFKGIPPSPF